MFPTSVTAPLNASVRPVSVAADPMEMDTAARMLPANCAAPPMVMEVPTFQNTLQGCAPLMRLITVAPGTVSVVPI